MALLALLALLLVLRLPAVDLRHRSDWRSAWPETSGQLYPSSVPPKY
ncbi:MAG: hypothetical protein IPL59_08275 [Candidatus Competibacteraceae bacterium]|nr:hypothetical protein [Candidatus Competibacteraceae bacterium]